MKRIISILLTITMVLCITTSIPLSASATADDMKQTSLRYTDEYGRWSYELTEDGSGYRITNYDGSIADVVVPSAIDNIPILEIGEHAFFSSDELISVIISDRVNIIGESAFKDCDKLTTVTIPDSVTAIEKEAFYLCDNLININISSNNKNYSSIDGVLFNKSQSELYCYPSKKPSESYVIPNGVTIIAENAFYHCDNIISITIPNTVTTIGDSAFKSCEKLASIIIPDSVATIDRSVFGNCTSLTSIVLPKSLTNIKEYVFSGCSNLTDVYYTGSESEWSNVTISDFYNGNDALRNATVHYDYVVRKSGDIDNDGQLSVRDALYIMKYIVGGIDLTEEQIAVADLNNDGDVRVTDVIILLKAILNS